MICVVFALVTRMSKGEMADGAKTTPKERQR